AGDPGGHEEDLRVGAVEQREQRLALRLLAASTRRTLATRRGVGGDDPPARRSVDAAELVPERARRRAKEHRVPSAKRLRIGAVGERDLDLDEHVAGAWPRLGNVLEPHVPRPVKDQRPQSRPIPKPPPRGPPRPLQTRYPENRCASVPSL